MDYECGYVVHECLGRCAVLVDVVYIPPPTEIQVHIYFTHGPENLLDI